MLNKAFRRASEKETLDPPGSTRWHDKQIGRNLGCQAANHIEHRRAFSKVGLSAGRQSTFRRKSLELLRELFPRFFCERNWQFSPRHCRSHEPLPVRRLIDVGDMDGRAEAPTQTLRGFDSLNRHSGEVDWDKDILDARLFHSQSLARMRFTELVYLAPFWKWNARAVFDFFSSAFRLKPATSGFSQAESLIVGRFGLRASISPFSFPDATARPAPAGARGGPPVRPRSPLTDASSLFARAWR